ncbi:non-ribosomal peptide synthetase [Amycolatopsis taiwanensis]|uniref:Peptide synthetase n=1 Tax=Amycolatopsis taiwanensis TaxID=342230 RepID=A0A9W6RA24_9PSEU|nr:non-ribosomal peptide synthetase [Amycolatopsis taiwanensis]GLY70302.1 peptide synthetase [Amycolatopsis taiwanensis]
MTVEVPAGSAADLAAAIEHLVRRYTGGADVWRHYGKVDLRAGEGGVTVDCEDERLERCLARDLARVLAGEALTRTTMEPEVEELDTSTLGQSIPDRFVRVAQAWPDRPAVRADDGELTYHELYRMASGIAAAVEAAIGGTGGQVGIMLGHGRRTPAAIMGVLLSGNAYVPLDPGYPAGRLRYMAEHARIGLVLVEPGTAGLAAELTGVPTVDVTTVQARDGAGTGPSTADSVAYVLYTSGSTGRPKGVLQSHRNVQFQVRNHVTRHAITGDDKVSVLSSFSFDASVTDLFTALVTGATAVLVDIRTHGLGHLARRLTETGVTIYHSTPTVYRYLLGSLGPGDKLPSIRVILLGGEELTARDVRLYRKHFEPHCVFVNGYGATEVSFACQNHVTMAREVPDGVLPIGRPLDGVEVVLLAPDGERAALHGEIVVRSSHVSVGYWENDEANAAKFLEVDGVRAYRTGDVGRRLPDGRIVFAGRTDRQVKIRGYRVELGEVEAALADHPAVGQVAAVARPKTDGTSEIVAYVAPVGGHHIDAVLLRKQVGTTLPHFMVPAAVVVLDALPLTPTGKIDARALPEPTHRGTAQAPRTDTERLVAGVWCDVLGVPSVGLDENFFDAGGHSLLMATVARLLEERLGREIPLHRLFQYPTVASLAAHLAEETAATGGLTAVADRMARRRMACKPGRQP